MCEVRKPCRAQGPSGEPCGKWIGHERTPAFAAHSWETPREPRAEDALEACAKEAKRAAPELIALCPHCGRVMDDDVAANIVCIEQRCAATDTGEG